jgi:hypothetical protein
VIAPPRPARNAAEEAIGAREDPRVVAEYGGVYADAPSKRRWRASFPAWSPHPTTRRGATRSPS